MPVKWSAILQGWLEHTEHQQGYQQSDNDVETLCYEKGIERPSVLFAEYVLEAGLEADTDKRYTEKGILEAFGDCSDCLGGRFVHTETEYYGRQYETYQNLREYEKELKTVKTNVEMILGKGQGRKEPEREASRSCAAHSATS